GQALDPAADATPQPVFVAVECGAEGNVIGSLHSPAEGSGVGLGGNDDGMARSRLFGIKSVPSFLVCHGCLLLPLGLRTPLPEAARTLSPRGGVNSVVR